MLLTRLCCLLLLIVSIASVTAARSGGTTYHFICSNQHTDAGVAYTSDVITETIADNEAYAKRRHELNVRFYEHLNSKGQWINNRWSSSPCRSYNVETLSWSIDEKKYFSEKQIGASYETIGGTLIRVVRADLPPGWENLPTPSIGQSEAKSAPLAHGNVSEQRDTRKRDLEEAAIRREQREAEFQAKLAAHEASVEDYQRKVAEREAEMARQKEELAADVAAAAREKAQHARLLEEHMKRQMDYEAARNRHTLCVNGNKEACAEIEAGKPAKGEKRADAGGASTDTDANQCVTTVETKLNASFKGNTSASVINGCGKPVDVRICLMTNKGWNCGDDSAVASQAKATHSSFNATGEVFVDARITGSNRTFNKPR